MPLKMVAATVGLILVGAVAWLGWDRGLRNDRAAETAADLASKADQIFEGDEEQLREFFSGDDAPGRPVGRVEVVARPQRGTLFAYKAEGGGDCMTWLERDGGAFGTCDHAVADTMLTPYRGDGAMVGMAGSDIGTVRITLPDGRRVSARTVPSTRTNEARFFAVPLKESDGSMRVAGLRGDAVVIEQTVP